MIASRYTCVRTGYLSLCLRLSGGLGLLGLLPWPARGARVSGCPKASSVLPDRRKIGPWQDADPAAESVTAEVSVDRGSRLAPFIDSPDHQ